MEKNTKVVSQIIRNKFSIVLFFLFFYASPSIQAYTDQIVIELPNGAKTIYDIRVHSFIHQLYEHGLQIDTFSKEWLSSFFEDERQNYIQQYLGQNYALENNLGLTPTPNEIQRGVQKIERVFKTKVEKSKAFALLDLSETDIEQWVTNRLTFDKFLTNTMQDRVIITDQKLQAHYEAWKSTRFLNRPYSEVAAKVRDDLSKTLLKEEFEKWVDQEKRREKMILKTVSTS